MSWVIGSFFFIHLTRTRVQHTTSPPFGAGDVGSSLAPEEMARGPQFSTPQPNDWMKGKVVGSGSFGTVHLAMNKSNGAFFVVKSAESEARIQILENEARILDSLNSPFVVQCLGRDISCRGNRPKLSIFLEYMAEGSLADVLEKFGGAFDEKVIRLYTRDILCGLQYLHRNGIVHCDLKCRNVLVDSTGRIKLGDFGFAKRLKDLDHSRKVVGGSPLWMAPEVLRNEGGDFAADIWSLGCTIIEMATGRPPWGDEISNPLAMMLEISNNHSTPNLPTHLSKEGLDFLGKCFERNPKLRSTAEELLNHPFLLGRKMTGKMKKQTFSPASILDFGNIEEDCDLYGKDCSKGGDFRSRNPFSTRLSCEREKGLEFMEKWHQQDRDFLSSDSWITVRSS